MQGLADGYFILPNTITNYLSEPIEHFDESNSEVIEAVSKTKKLINDLMSIDGKRSVDSFHRELGNILWEKCGINRTEEGLKEAIEQIRQLRKRFWKEIKILGSSDNLNQSLERAGRLVDFLELAELVCIDALHRKESCGSHFRAESQTQDGEALRNDNDFAYVAAWEFSPDSAPILHKEYLVYEKAQMKKRSYK